MGSDGEDDALTYDAAGVSYGKIDPAKVLAQRLAAATAPALGRWQCREVPESRGESAYVWEEADSYRALVIEGLGTKSLVAEAVRRFTGRTHYDAIAQDTVAMIVNDLAAVGAQPQVVTAFWAAGSSAWFDDRERSEDLARGWAAACEAVGATWGGGETEVLPDLIAPGAVDLAGAAVGIVRPKSHLLLGDALADGDAIVLVASSGIHANGLSLARRIAERLPNGYATDIGDGTTFGESLLVPTHLYPPLIADCFEAGVELHYVSHITGHGWRKLMRARRELRYVIERLPACSPLFEFLVRHGGLDLTEAYGNLNMGAGLALYLPERWVSRVVALAERRGLAAWPAGRVERGPRQVVLAPLGITFEAATLTIRRESGASGDHP